MREKIQVEKAIINNENEVIFDVSSDISIGELKATGQMLVDSDQLAFVYLVDKNENFAYIELTYELWPILKQGLDNKSEYKLSNGEETLKLPNLQEELHYLIENIKGNSNYGEEMVTKVENTFGN